MELGAAIPGQAEGQPTGFSRERLSRLRAMERWHFWFQGRRALVERLLHRHAGTRHRALDLGCGTGYMLESLACRAAIVVGLDRRPEGLLDARRALPRSLVVQADALELPFATSRFDLVTLFDVLEHVDDHRLLAEIHRVLAPGGLAVLTVPAMPWLWSQRDRAAGHLRRYTRQGLARALEACGLAVQEMRYYLCLLFPLVMITRVLGGRRPGMTDAEERVPPAINRALAGVNRLEARLGDTVRWPWGSSLVAVCRKC